MKWHDLPIFITFGGQTFSALILERRVCLRSRREKGGEGRRRRENERPRETGEGGEGEGEREKRDLSSVKSKIKGEMLFFIELYMRNLRIMNQY